MNELGKTDKEFKKKYEEFGAGLFWGLIYFFIVAGVGMLLKYDYQVIGFTLICCGVFGIYKDIVEHYSKTNPGGKTR